MSRHTYIPAPPFLKYKSRSLFFPPDTHSVTLPPSRSHTFSSFSFQGVIWTIWRMRRGRRASTTSMASSLPSSSPLRQRPPLAMATVSSLTSVQWAPCCCCFKLYWAQWSMPSWWAAGLEHYWEMGRSYIGITFSWQWQKLVKITLFFRYYVMWLLWQLKKIIMVTLENLNLSNFDCENMTHDLNLSFIIIQMF